MDHSFSISGEGEFHGDLDAIRKLAVEHWPKELARLQEMSLILDARVTYDMSIFGEEWSPMFHHSSDDAVAWTNSRTGETIDGSKHPNAA